jgi:hypothetical protein
MTQTMSTSPGWYPDPAGGHEWRWFDGTDWTDAVADHGVAGQAPLGPPPAMAALGTPQPQHTALDPADQGSFMTRWIKLQEVVVPRCYVACGEPDAFGSMEVGGSDWAGKLFVTLKLPVCSHCESVLTACGIRPGKNAGGLVHVWGAPKELKPELKAIQRSVKVAVKRMGWDTGVRFTFSNRRFAEAFDLVNPAPERKHFWG